MWFEMVLRDEMRCWAVPLCGSRTAPPVSLTLQVTLLKRTGPPRKEVKSYLLTHTHSATLKQRDLTWEGDGTSMLRFRDVLTWFGVCWLVSSPLLVPGIGSRRVEIGDLGGTTPSWLDNKGLDDEVLVRPSITQSRKKWLLGLKSEWSHMMSYTGGSDLVLESLYSVCGQAVWTAACL